MKIVYGATRIEQDSYLDAVLMKTLIKDIGLILNKAKCHFGKKKKYSALATL